MKAFLLTPTDKPESYLTASEVIDFCRPEVADQARALAVPGDPTATARSLYEWVRDEIPHSCDVETTLVPVSASQVLAWRTGLCFAKSHLLTALLRAVGIPAGLCYQRVRAPEWEAGFVLHGLAAAQLPDVGWYLMDPRGQQAGH